jgi:alpha-beta hydrolase superfamily lysophospholipase
MFSIEDATALRATLEPMRFQGQAPAKDSELLGKYRAHYGLNFSSPERPIQQQIGLLEIPAARDHYQLVCQHFALPLTEQKGTAFLLHGYFDHAGLFAHLIQHCLDLGLSVVIIDLPGHGLSSGQQASIDSFSRYVQALTTCLQQAAKDSLAHPWYFIGQSTGAAVLLDALLQGVISEDCRAERVILLAPLLRPLHWLKSRMLFSVSRLFLAATPRGFSDNSHDQEFLQFLRQQDALQSQSIPRDWVLAMIDYQRRFRAAKPCNEALHIIQGSEDGTVDWRYNLKQIQAKFPAAKTTMVDGARHHMVNESKEYRDKIFGLISQVIES